MELINCLRAKSKKEGQSYLLKDHIVDTLKRVKALKKFIENNYEAIEFSQFKDPNFFKDLAKALFLHDLGKINFSFQKQVFSKEEKEKENWKKIEKFFEKNWKKIDVKDHEIISTLYTYLFLGNDESSKKIRTAILLHHYNNFYIKEEPHIRYIFDDYPDLVKYIEFLIEKKEEIKKLLEELLSFCIRELSDPILRKALKELSDNLNFEKIRNLKEGLERGYGLSNEIKFYEEVFRDEKNEEIDKKMIEFFAFLGCLRRCDYSASGNVNIEENINLETEFYNNLLTKIKKSIKKENEKIWQEKILNKKDFSNLVLIAPTGSGKTEFALLWAKNRGKKLIYTLPLRVALNDLYWRFKVKEEGKESYFSPDLVYILHSTSFIEYLKGENSGQDVDVETKVSGARIFSSPLLLTTPDQVFLSSLKYYGFDKLLSVYPLSSIVIDEIQAYNPEMAAVIIKTLNIIKELNGNILLITATFPPYFASFLNEENGFKIIDLEKESEELRKEVKNYSIKRHKINLMDKSLFYYDQKSLVPLEEGFKEIKKLIKNNPNKNIMILVNNVEKAISVYKLLTQYYKNSKNKENKKWREIQKLFEDLEPNTIELLHSRIIEKEKSERIERIKEKLKNGERVILVATQIVEASVDVDFDILITEISPIDSQIQRWGRIWRNRKENYEENKPNIYIFTNIDKDRGTKAIYHPKEILDKTIEVLKEIEDTREALNYEKERELINKVFDRTLQDGGTLKQLYENKIKETLEWLRYYSAEKRIEAQKLFRNIAGIQVFVPDLSNENDKIYETLCEILNDKKNWNLPFESSSGDSIVSIIRNKLNNEKINKWKILETLYKYSFSLPIFGLKSNKVKYQGLEKGDFKGFFVLKENDKNKLEEIKKFGVSSIKEVPIDDLEIESNEENII